MLITPTLYFLFGQASGRNGEERCDPGCHGLWVTMSMILSGYHRKLQAFSQSAHLVDDERCGSAPALCGVRPRRHL